MLSEIALEVHNIECLLKKSRTLGVISCLVDVHKNRNNSVLIGRVEKIYPLIKKSDLCKRDQLRFVLKEVYPDGNYGHHFLAVFFNKIAVEIDSAKLIVGDKLVFKEPHVFVYATYRPIKILHNLYVQIGLGDIQSPTLWFARKYQQDMKRRRGKQVKSSKNGTSESMVTSPAAILKNVEVPSSVTTDVRANEIEILDGEQSHDDADKTHSDCFVFLEDISPSPCVRQSSDNENNNVKDNTQLKIDRELQSKHSSASEQNKITQMNKVTVDKQHFNTLSKENTGMMCKNIQENITDTHGQQEKNCNTEKKSTQKSVKSSSSNEKEAKTMNVSPHTSPEKMSGTSSGSRTTEENNNIKQQTVTLADDIRVLQVVTCSKPQESTPNRKIINNEIRKLGLPGTSKYGIDEVSNKNTHILGPETYDEKLFMYPVIILNDVTQNKYKIFVSNSKETESDNVNSENKVFRSPPKLKKLTAESDDSDDCRVNNEDRSPPKLSDSSLLFAEANDIDHSNASDSTVELEGLLISRKRGFVKTRSLCRKNKKIQIQKSLSSNESVPLFKPPPSSSSSPLKNSDATLVPCTSKLFTSEKTEYLLSDKGQEQCSSVLSLFGENKGNEKDILLEHSYSTVNKDSSVQDSVSCVSRSCTINNDNNNLIITTAVIHDNEFTKPELTNMSNKQTDTTTKQCSLKNNNDSDSNDSDIVAEAICNSSSSEVANLKRKNYKTAAATTTTKCSVISTRPSKPRRVLIKSYGEAVTATSHKHNVCLDSEEVYTACRKRKSNATLANNNSIAKIGTMVRFDYALPERKKRSISKTPAQMETEDDICNGNEAVRETSAAGDSIIIHQYLDGDCELSVLTGFLVDICPQALGTMDLIIGQCEMQCGVHRYSDLIWVKNEEKDEPRCPACFKQGTTRKVHLIFMFSISVMATDGSIHNFLVFGQPAEHFLGCTVQEYITNKARRLIIRDMFKSHMISATSGRENAPKIRFCVCDKHGIKVLMKDISTTPINSL